MQPTRKLILMPLAIAAAMLAGRAQAQWTVVSLHPATADFSEALATNSGQQGGYAAFSGYPHASLWSGTAASWIDLNPMGSMFSAILGVDGGMQVGSADVAGAEHASFWGGSAASWIDLNPFGAAWSQALAADGSEQSGVADVGGIAHASRWTGSAASWTDLNPGISTEMSYVLGAGGGKQVGFAEVSGFICASLWAGSAATWVDLSPAGSDYSYAYGTDGASQAGFASFAGVMHAGRWSGTAASWVDLNPAGADYSSASAVEAGQQVGYAVISGTQSAALWSGTAASFVNLGSFLSADFTWSTATGIWHDGPNTYVSGSGYNSSTGRYEALMWVKAGYSWSGFLQPINMAGTSVFKLGQTIPVKFRLTGASAGITNLVAHLYIAKVIDGIVGTEEEADSNACHDDGDTFRYDDGKYIFNLGTKHMSKGTWRLRVDMGDGIERTVLISLRK